MLIEHETGYEWRHLSSGTVEGDDALALARHDAARAAYLRGEPLALRYMRSERGSNGELTLRPVAVVAEVVDSDDLTATIAICDVRLVLQWHDLGPLSTIDCELTSPHRALRLARLLSEGGRD